MTDEQRKKQGFKKGHKCVYSGKKMDYNQFIKAYNLYTRDRKINQKDFAKLVEISVPTLKKRLHEFFFDGYIDGKYFSNGVAIKSDWYDIKQEEYEAVRKMYKAQAEHENKSILKVLYREINSNWYHACKSQRYEYAEGLNRAMQLVEDMLYDGIRPPRHRNENIDREQSGSDSESPEQGDGLRDTQDNEGDNNFRV